MPALLSKLTCGVIYTDTFRAFLARLHEQEAAQHPWRILTLDYLRCASGPRRGVGMVADDLGTGGIGARLPAIPHRRRRRAYPEVRATRAQGAVPGLRERTHGGETVIV